MVRFVRAICVMLGMLLVMSAAKAETKEVKGKTGAEIQKLYDDLVGDGWTPTMIKGKPGGGISKYEMTWVNDKIGSWYFYFGLDKKMFEEKKEEMSKQGLNLIQDDHWTVGKTEKYAAIWHAPDDPGRREAKFGKITFVHVKGFVWEMRGKGKGATPVKFMETKRTKEYVEIANKKKKLAYRIYADHIEEDISGGGGFVKSKDKDFSGGGAGGFVTPK